MKIVFWWDIPCKGMIDVLRHYSELEGEDVIIITGELSTDRKNMGWENTQRVSDKHFIIKDDEWGVDIPAYIGQYKDYLHVINGYTFPKRIHNLQLEILKQGILFCNMSESYCDISFNYLRYIKKFYHAFVLPVRLKEVSKKSLGVICLSGKDEKELKKFEKLGWNPQRIRPFGYYTEYKSDTEDITPRKDSCVHLVCSGNLEYYKGVHVLLDAIDKLKRENISDFHCHIVGKGSMDAELRNKAGKLKLNNLLTFHGVLSQKEYNRVFSNADILVAPGIVEPWGIRINEAIQAGLAVVVSDKMGAAELINQSNGGYVFESRNDLDLSEKLKALITNHDTLKKAKENNIIFRDKISCYNKALYLREHIEYLYKNHTK